MAKSRKISPVVSLVVFGVLVVNSAPVSGGDWPNWRGSDYDGISKESNWNPKALAGGAKIKWKASVGIGFSAISVAKGKAYTMGNIDGKDHVYCLDASSGKRIWDYSYGEAMVPFGGRKYKGGPNATRAVDSDKVYTISKSGKVYCLSASSGKMIWKAQVSARKPRWGFSGSPLVLGEMLILNAGDYGVALDKTTGKTIWQNGRGAAGYSSVVPFTKDGKKCISLFAAKEVIGMEAKTGTEVWKCLWNTPYQVNAADPIIDGDKVYITSGYKKGCALVGIEGHDAKLLWKNKNMKTFMSGPVLWKGYVYGIDESGRKSGLACLELKTGKLMWFAADAGNGSLMLADGKLIVLSERGKLIIAEASPESFKKISSAQILNGKCWTMPSFANGKVYARNEDGDMVCVDMSNSK